MLLSELLYYKGEPLESGGTSMQAGAAPAMRSLYPDTIKDGMTVLDFGAGKYARNADFFRAHGLKTYAFDPFNSNAAPGEGWDKGKIANAVSLKVNGGKKFDVAFTCFVLNVVPKHVEEDILKDIAKLGKKLIHVTRNMDVFDMVKAALLKKDKFVYPFFVKEFKGKDGEEPSDETILKFCQFGVQTSRGFQRIPDLKPYGYDLIKSAHGYKIYVK